MKAAGAVVVAVAYGLGIVLLTEIWQLVIVSVMLGAGIGLAYGAMPALIMAAVPVEETAAANGLNTLMRAIGTSTCSAVSGAVLAQLTIPFGPAVVPSLTGLRVIMAIGAGAALVALVFAALLSVRRASAVAEPAAASVR